MRHIAVQYCMVYSSSVQYSSLRYSAVLFLSRLGCSLGELQDVWPDKFCQAKHPEDQNPASIYGQDMELLMTESHMHLQDFKSSPHLLPRTATEVCLPSG